MDINIKGTVKEIVFKSETLCLFVIENEVENELACSITKSKIELADMVKVGQAVNIKGKLAARRVVKQDKVYVSNVIYVNELN